MWELHIASAVIWSVLFFCSLFLYCKLSDETFFRTIQIILIFSELFRIIWSCNIEGHRFLPIGVSDVLLHTSQVALLSVVTYLIFNIRCMLYRCISYETFGGEISIYPNFVTLLVVVITTSLVTFFPNYVWVFRGISYITMVTHAWVLVAMSISLIL